MKAARLEFTGARMRFRQTIFPERNPPFDRELQIAWRAEEVHVIGHEQVIADEPCGRRVLPDIVQRALDACISQPTFAVFRAYGEENPIRTSE